MRKTLILSAALLVATAASADDVEHKFQSLVGRGQVQRVLIDIPAASFTIRNGSNAHIGVSGVASRDYDGHRERIWAQRVVDDTSVEVFVNGADAVIRRKFGPNADSWRAQKFTGLDLRIDLPAGVDVKFETTAGEVDLAGDFNHVDVDLRAGEVDVKLPRARVRELNASCRVGEVNTNLGTEVVSKEGLFPGRTHYFNARGRSNVNVHVTAGEVNVTLVP
ncbi:MAG TPA: hypothetical protein VND45_12770 [Thermoanaerobaculia bacterium]|jgi:hypothetical protein|nr:hypothetical protein [Thermoanaerobaculia bacterium]